MYRLIQRLAATRPMARVAAAILMPVDLKLAQWSAGRWTLASSLVGLPVVILTTVGAKSGAPRSVPLVAVLDGDRVVVFGSSFGRRHHPGWYYNLRARPQATVARNGVRQQYSAREANDGERQAYWAKALALYPGYAQYERRAGRRIPIIVLEPDQPSPD